MGLNVLVSELYFFLFFEVNNFSELRFFRLAFTVQVSGHIIRRLTGNWLSEFDSQLAGMNRLSARKTRVVNC